MPLIITLKDVLQEKYYCRHMDDWYVIVDTKEEADEILRDISKMYAEIGIEMNPKKTQKIKLSHGFTWLQDRYFLTENGKVIRKASHKRIAQYRKKLKKKWRSRWKMARWITAQLEAFTHPYRLFSYIQGWIS